MNRTDTRKFFHLLQLPLRLIFICMLLSGTVNHPIYVSVAELEYNEQEQQLEVSCRIFANDLEATLKKNFGGQPDLLHPSDKEKVGQLVVQYLANRFKVEVNNLPVKLKFLGYEPEEEAVRVYFVAEKIGTPKKIKVYQTILYDFNPQQMGIVHVTVKGERKSKRIAPPEDWAEFVY